MPVFVPKKVLYLVKGTHFRLNFIDSNNNFQQDRIFKDSFRYEFTKAPGNAIGMSIFRFSPTDQIFGWALYFNGKLYANAFSEGAVYSTVPFY